MLTADVNIGDKAPGFTLPSQDGEQINMGELLGKKEIVLYFYPKDNTPGCTTEARAFRDDYDSFRQLDVELFGISSDTVDSHRDFAAKCSLPFKLLSDTGGKVRKLYEVPASLGLLPGRVTYVIDSRGVVRHIFSSQMNPRKHVSEAVRILKSIREEGE